MNEKEEVRARLENTARDIEDSIVALEEDANDRWYAQHGEEFERLANWALVNRLSADTRSSTSYKVDVAENFAKWVIVKRESAALPFDGLSRRDRKFWEPFRHYNDAEMWGVYKGCHSPPEWDF